MPIIKNSTYKAPWFLKGMPHVQTIFPNLFRRVTSPPFTRQRIETPDADFLDIDLAFKNGKSPSSKLAILSHGLEGSTDRWYIRGMVHALHRADYDVLAWNFRGCSGSINRILAYYHSGKSEDLEAVIQHVLNTSDYKKIALIGFSVGGNITLKYLGERGKNIPHNLLKAVCFSVPVDLEASSRELAKPSNRIYMDRFLKTLKQKVRDKMEKFPGEIDDRNFKNITNFKEFDDRYTAPLNGFKNAHEYWAAASSKQYLKNISIPTLLVNAENDPFLAPECYPVKESEANPNLFLEMPADGGHMGFTDFSFKNEYWSERRAVEFLIGDS
ncbi:MAG TPA: alpha/beta fold hydrolase [Patescibacteria group bacterium]|nr:alpha/beta fold hydrolase [Patescibacteria group bacterium]